MGPSLTQSELTQIAKEKLVTMGLRPERSTRFGDVGMGGSQYSSVWGLIVMPWDTAKAGLCSVSSESLGGTRLDFNNIFLG